MRILTLEYHDVLRGADFDASGFPGAGANTYKLALPDFEAHLARLPAAPRAGGDVRSVAAAPEPILLTFDDGGSSAIDVIAPALERHGYVGHFFITTARIDDPTFCSSEALRELQRRGHVVGSHSHSHPVRMATLTDHELQREWQTSCELLAEVLGEPVTVASVPGGYYSARVARAAAKAGIRHLFTSEPVRAVESVDGCRVYGRFTLRRSSPAAEVASLVRPLGAARLRQWLLWNAKKLAKTLAGETYLRLRQSLLGRASPPPSSRN